MTPHRRPRPAARLAALAVLLSGCSLAPGAAFIDRREVDLSRLLAPPPAAGSAAAEAELARVLAVQAARTAAESAAALADDPVSVFRFSDVLGPAFSADRLPKTAAFFGQAGREASLIAADGKRIWDRPRPFVTSPDVRPLLQVAHDGSYPSGHATWGYFTAILLADLVPERRAELFERGRRYGENRTVDGVHYPSDVEGGRITAAIVATLLWQRPAFRRALDEARAELRPVLGLQ